MINVKSSLGSYRILVTNGDLLRILTSLLDPGMRDLQRLISYCFQDNGTLLVFVMELPNPCYWAIFPEPMHTINRRKHAWEPLIYINIHLMHYILTSRLSQIPRSEACPNSQNTSLRGFHGNEFTQSAIFIYCIPRCTIR